jgi:hypothetical protein
MAFAADADARMDSYPLQRAVFDLVRAHEGADGQPADTGLLSEPERAALRGADLRALARFGVHPVLIHSLARATGRSRDEYRVLLLGTGSALQGRPRWRAS